MDAHWIVQWWGSLLEGWFGPVLHGHQARALAEFSLAVARAGRCSSGAVAAAVGRPAASVASQRRRFERLLANGRLDLAAAWPAIARGVLDLHAPGRPRVLLVLDETPRGNDLRAMCVRLVVRRRALPLACRCYALGGAPGPMPELVEGLLDEVDACLPEGADVTLLVDRGLTWPESVLGRCLRLGWHFVGRVQGQTSVRVEGERRHRRADALCPRPGDVWAGRARVFREAGWLDLTFACRWDPRADGPWLLVSDLPPHAAGRVADYAKRMWAEESFRDDKSAGWQWQASRVLDARHAWVLLTVMALASVLTVEVGLRVIKRGLRRRIDPHVRDDRLSVFTLGLRWIAHTLCCALAPPAPP